MTLKLSTMLLPTGRFVLIATREKSFNADQVERLRQFSHSTGALTALFVDGEEVVAEDAFVDDLAADSFDITGNPRVEYVVDEQEEDEADEDLGDALPAFDFNAWRQQFADAAGQVVEALKRARGEEEPAVSQDFTVDPITQQAWDLVQNGAEVTPAGLLHLTEEQKTSFSALTEEELTAAVNPLVDQEFDYPADVDGLIAQAPVAEEEDVAPPPYGAGGWLLPGITTIQNATNTPEPVIGEEDVDVDQTDEPEDLSFGQRVEINAATSLHGTTIFSEFGNIEKIDERQSEPLQVGSKGEFYWVKLDDGQVVALSPLSVEAV